MILMDVDNTKYPFCVQDNSDDFALTVEATGVRIGAKDLTMIQTAKGVVMTTAGGTKRVRLNDAANDTVTEAV
jgi:hypothetical protein